MIDNKIRIEIDESGNYVESIIGSVRALADYTTTLEVVSPLPLNTSVLANFYVFDSRNIELPLFLFPTTLLGNQVSDNPLVADWNVWEAGIDGKVLAAISKYRAGRIAVAFSFRERRPSNIATNYRGAFKQANQLPLLGNMVGDYFVCSAYNVAVGTDTYTYEDNAVWDGINWVRDGNIRVILTTPSLEIPVDPSLLANVIDVPEQDIADIIATWGAGFIDMINHINNTNNPHNTTPDNIVYELGKSLREKIEEIEEVSNRPDNVTIVLNDETELSVSENLELDGGFL